MREKYVLIMWIKFKKLFTNNKGQLIQTVICIPYDLIFMYNTVEYYKIYVFKTWEKNGSDTN